jgi:HemY protein
MIRVVIYLIAVGVLAFAAVWLADRPGDVVITWQGLRANTSVMVLVVAVAVVAVATVFLWTILRALLRAPRALRHHHHSRRNARGYRALSHGLIAVGSGDARAARRYAEEAMRLAPHEPLTLLLGAQSAQLAGDRPGAERTFRKMAQRHDTKLLGLHGLFIEAQRRHDAGAAALFAEEAARTPSPPAWAGLAVLQIRCAAGDWGGALDRLERNMQSGLIDKPTYRRQRAVLLTARAIAAESTDRAGARELALEAVSLVPTLVPAAALAGRLLGEAGAMRRAARVIDTAWKANPHPDLAEAYAHLRPGDAARDRLARVEALAKRTPEHVEGALAVAGAALDAREFAIARAALAPLLAAPTQRVAMLMARLEGLEHGDEGRAREWMTRALRARRDPAWTADGFVSDRWMPISPVSGRLDAFVWQEPQGELGRSATIDSHDDDETPAIAAPTAAVEPSVPQPSERREPESADTVTPSFAAPETHAIDATRATPPAAAAPSFEKVIPLLHAPDDPGPDAEMPVEPETESTPPPAPNGWKRFRQLFK